MRYHIRTLDGPLGKHIGFSFKFPLTVQLFQGTQKEIADILTEHPLIGLGIDPAILCCKGIVSFIQLFLQILNGFLRVFLHLQADQFLGTVTNP